MVAKLDFAAMVGEKPPKRPRLHPIYLSTDRARWISELHAGVQGYERLLDEAQAVLRRPRPPLAHQSTAPVYSDEVA